MNMHILLQQMTLFEREGSGRQLKLLKAALTDGMNKRFKLLSNEV